MARDESTSSTLMANSSLIIEDGSLSKGKKENMTQNDMISLSSTNLHSNLNSNDDKSQKNNSAKYPVEALLRKAKEFRDVYLDDMALKFYEKAYEQEPLNQLVLDSYSEFLVNWNKQQQQNGELLSTDHTERCKFLLQESIRLDSVDVSIEEEESKQIGGNFPEDFIEEALIQKLNPSKYLYLAQLQVGGDALRSYEEGIKKLKILHDYTSQKLKHTYLGDKVKTTSRNNNLMELKDNEVTVEVKGIEDTMINNDKDDNMIEYDDDENTLKIMKYQICNAYCSMCDIYMTDLCYEDNAEEMCITYVTEASAYDVGAVEYLSTLASLRLSQVNNEEAVMYLLECYKRIKYIYKELQSSKNLSQPDLAFLEMITPSLESKVSLAKMLLEVDQLIPGKGCARKAGNILYICRTENDTDPEIMFLMGVALFTMNPPDYDASLEILNLAISTLEKQQKEHKKMQKRKVTKQQSSTSFSMQEEQEDLEEELSALNAQVNLVRNQIILVQKTMQTSSKGQVEKTEDEDEVSEDDFDFGLCMYEAPLLEEENDEEEDDDDNDDDRIMQEERNV